MNERTAALRRFIKVLLSGAGALILATAVSYTGGILNIQVDFNKIFNKEVIVVITALIAAIEKFLKEKRYH